MEAVVFVKVLAWLRPSEILLVPFGLLEILPSLAPYLSRNSPDLVVLKLVSNLFVDYILSCLPHPGSSYCLALTTDLGIVHSPKLFWE